MGVTSFTEIPAWAEIGSGWRRLHGRFQESGYSVEWHDFEHRRDLDWSRSFHPGGVEICMNLAGNGSVRTNQSQLQLTPLTAGFYAQRENGLTGIRAGGERHQFITVELSSAFLDRYLPMADKGLHPNLKKKTGAWVSEPIRLGAVHQQMIATLQHPPVYAAATGMWYHAKAMEVASAFLFRPSDSDELFCQRQKRQNQERVESVIAVLKENLAEGLPLKEIGRRVGCSHFHLSRIFSQETGKSIFQYLRELRLERAAELLREGRLNVTQVALEVGYSSPSHFSTAFHESFGCCPGLYPMATTTQRKVNQRRS